MSAQYHLEKHICPAPTPQSEELDKVLQAALGKMTNGLSPAVLMLAFLDWYMHLAMHPVKQMQLWQIAQDNYLHLYRQFISSVMSGDQSGEFCALTIPEDKRFINKNWQIFPFNFIYESFLMMQSWWHCAVSGVRGVSRHHQEVVDFTIRQYLDMLSPSNFPFLNPEVMEATIKTQGQNFIKGYENFLDDTRRYIMQEPPAGSEKFVIGKNIAITPGKVIYRNRLMELIQYSPETENVYSEPVLITPAWIMKYYILDLTPKHSLVKYLVKKGHTVFMISWKNPKKKDKDLSMEDYLNLGIMSGIKVIQNIIPQHKINLIGYCLGGTLAAIAAAKMARDNEDYLSTLTLLAAQVDFTEPGELGLFIDESQISYLENLMAEKGYLDTHQMSGAFQILRSNDLIWSRIIREYLLGERKPLTDLMAWNADATRLPYRMHSEYLRQLFLKNSLAKAQYHVGERPIALTDIQIPIFVVATERDHVSPWRSVFKINLLTNSDVTFVLTSGGHNVGIVSLPSKKTKRRYRISTLKEGDRYVDADTWHKQVKPKGGSWWPALEHWLSAHSGAQIPAPKIGCDLEGCLATPENAPGTYVLEK